MPRHPRTHLDGVPLHIVPRGHSREACFVAEDDYLAYRCRLGEAPRESPCRRHPGENGDTRLSRRRSRR